MTDETLPSPDALARLFRPILEAELSELAELRAVSSGCAR